MIIVVIVITTCDKIAVIRRIRVVPRRIMLRLL